MSWSRGIRKRVAIASIVSCALAVVPATVSSGTPTSANLGAARTVGPRPAAHLVAVNGFITGGLSTMPVVRARVRVYALSTQNTARLLAATWTGRKGVAFVNLRSVPRHLVVTLSGGWVEGSPFNGVLKSEVASYSSPRTICVNPLTTVVRTLDDLHRNLSLSQAQKRVKTYFRLPPRYGPNCELLSDAHFDGRLFLTDARTHGGFNALVQATAKAIYGHPLLTQDRYRRYKDPDVTKAGGVQQRVSAGPASARSARHLGSSPRSSARLPHGFSGALASISANLGSIQRLASGGWNAYQVYQLLNGQGTTAQLAALSQQISTGFTNLETSIDNLDSSVQTVQNTLNNIQNSTAASNLSSAISNEENTANTIADASPEYLTAFENWYQIACGDSSGGNPLSPCTTPQSPSTLCPSQTLLTYDSGGGGVDYPAPFTYQSWPGPETGYSQLELDCVAFSTAMWAPNGVQSYMSSLASSSTAGPPWPAMQSFYNFVVGQGSQLGILQLAFQEQASQTRFLDTTGSSNIQLLFDYYLSLYQSLSLEVAFEATMLNDQNLPAIQPPSVAQMISADPTTVPAGVVVDTQTGLMWAQDISANASSPAFGPHICIESLDPFVINTDQGLAQTPSTLTGTSITPSSSSCLPALGGSTSYSLNVSSNPVTPINPITVSSAGAGGSPFSDFYAAGSAQLQSLYTYPGGTPNSTEPGDTPANASSQQTAGDWLQTQPSTGGGAGFNAAIFGANNANANSQVGQGVSAAVTNDWYYNWNPLAGLGGQWQQSSTVPIANGPQVCTLAGNSGCGAPAFLSDQSPYVFDLNNGNLNPQGAFSNSISATNWNQSLNWCVDDNWDSTSCTGRRSYSAVFQDLNDNGFVTWFYRNPPVPTPGATSECYYYRGAGSPPPLAGSYYSPSFSNGAGDPSNCGSLANLGASDHGGLASQALVVSG